MKHLTFSKKLIIASFLTFYFLLSTFNSSAQAPQSFQYQAVVRDNGGVAMPTQNVGFQLSIISGSPGTVEYVETHSAITNAFGVVTLSVGTGSTTFGTFSAITWGSATHFLKVETDLGSGYVDMGTTQLLSVPYALYAETAGNAGQTYTSGNGINITGNVIDNTAPDQVVNLNGTGSTSVSGTYPNFTINSTDNNTVYNAGSGIDVTGTTITNTTPDQTVNLTGAGSTSITGTYPNFTITSTGGTVPYTAGSGIDVTGTVISNTAPDQTVNLSGTGATSVTGTYPNFTVNSVDNVNDADADPINEIQTLGIAGQTLSISSGNSVTIPATTYTAGSGINVTGTVISNTAPDQTVAITGGGATAVSGTYPNFTVTSTDNNTTYTAGTGMNLTGTTFNSTQTLAQTLANGNTAGTYSINMNNNNITGAHILGLGASNTNYIDMYNGHIYDYNGNHGINGQVLTVHGTSPNTYVTWDAPTSYTFGNGLTLTGNTVNSVWSKSGNHIYNNNTGNVGVGINNPIGKMVVQGDTATSDTIPLFEVKDKLGHTVFVVYPDSVHIYVKDTGVKSNKGGFAVSGKNTAKALTHDFLYVDPDFTRIYTGDTTAGFGVENIGASGDNSYMHLTPNNYLIGHQAGDSLVSTGMYNSFFGYKCGISDKGGSFNVFSGYKTGYLNQYGNYNTFLGFEAGYNNTSSDNTFIGYLAGKSHTIGGGNVYIGSKAGQNDISGARNIFIGEYAGLSNTTAFDNICLGFSAGKSNTTGWENVFIGTESGMFNTTASYNVFLGYYSGHANTTGADNLFIGSYTGQSNTIGNNNTFVGRSSGQQNVDGNYNTFVGSHAGIFNTQGIDNVFIGYEAGRNNLTGNKNLAIGNGANYSVTTGSENICFGNAAGYSSNGNQNTIIGHSAGFSNIGSGNVFLGYRAGNSELGSNKLYIENSNDISTPLINGDFSTNRIAFNRQATTYPLQVGTTAANGNGAYLTAGGIWTAGSSRSFKDRFVELNAPDILNKILNMDLKGWFYKETQEYHIGPFAEDFYNAFGTGVLDVKEDLGRYLSATDVSGVSMVAIKELIKQNNELRNQVENISIQNNDLKSEIEKIKESIDKLNSK